MQSHVFSSTVAWRILYHPKISLSISVIACQPLLPHLLEISESSSNPMLYEWNLTMWSLEKEKIKTVSVHK